MRLVAAGPDPVGGDEHKIILTGKAHFEGEHTHGCLGAKSSQTRRLKQGAQRLKLLLLPGNKIFKQLQGPKREVWRARVHVSLSIPCGMGTCARPTCVHA